MNYKFTILLSVVCLTLAAGQAFEEYTCLRIEPGPVMVIDYKGVETKARLIGVHVPEIQSSDKPADYYVIQTQELLKNRAEGKQLKIELDEANAGKEHRDDQGCLLVYAYLPNGEMLNFLLIWEGYARIDHDHDFRTDRKALFKHAEQETRNKKRRIWNENIVEKKKKPPIVPKTDWPKQLRIGFVPQGGEIDQNTLFPQIGQYLTRELTIEVIMIPMKDYETLIKKLSDHTLEGGYMGASSYVRASKIASVRAVAMELGPDGSRGYHSVIIVRQDSGISNLEQARGKVLAFTDPLSTSGFRVPLIHFIQEMGETPATFASQVVFAGNHQAVIEGVFKGDYDLGATNNNDFARLSSVKPMSPDSFRVIWTSPALPRGAFCLRDEMPDTLKKALQEALKIYKDETLFSGLDIGGYGPTDDAEYNIIREANKIIE